MAFNTKAVTNVLVDAVSELVILDASAVALALACDVVVVDDLVKRF